ncbi:MAG: LuxR C-terminal-related transcriptional regulator [Sphaerotilus natans subsp. sulfidivorans]|uniref:LuxR C-terminal-related transcriptional regulator n=1 Tax=Sphaerotilus sulfidivorans TaxID=639200 RepID=UPI002353842B|nr:LuxR C-terminal-related transcriptional regulator [Sphaerotilus sulfidivorans]MCK6401347.1 LuxR C-terminal-related transcriptional regulator [Sphaerotilus sulfidivorans]
MNSPLNHDASLALKSMPPRVVRGFLDRERLRLSRLELGGMQAYAVIAPTGFGKTAQLVQWRREALARGALAFWMTADVHDEPLRFVHGLAQAAMVANGKRGFGEAFQQRLAACVDAQDAATLWLAEVASIATDTVLLIDDVEHLPAASRSGVLTYLLGNLPPNLSLAVAARSSAALQASGVLSRARVNRVTVAELRFRLDETLAVLSSALGVKFNADAAVRLHELTEGWPLGIQLAVGALTRGGDLEGLLAAASSDIRGHFVDAVIERQSPNATHLLIRLARFRQIHPDLCSHVMGDAAFADVLMGLHLDTPLLMRADGESWMSLHPLAREVLSDRLRDLPAAELAALSRRASDWYAQNDLLEEAAEHAFLAGDASTAMALMEKSSKRLTVQGRSASVLAWYDRLSNEEVGYHPALWAPAAWALAMSDRHQEAEPLMHRISTRSGVTDGERFEAGLIGIVSSSFSDRVDRVAEQLADWPEPSPDAAPGLAPIHLDARAHLLLLQGCPDAARIVASRIGQLDLVQVYSPVSFGFAAFVIGLSHLWEGRALLAEEGLRPALARAEERLRRSHPIPCMLAALLAQACWEGGRDTEAVALLAGRIDVLERFGMPDTVMAAHLTLARISEQEGRQSHALSQLERLRAIGRARGMIRLQVLAQAELVRLHARHGRSEIALLLSAELDTLIRGRRLPTPADFVPWLELHAEMARAQALLAADNSTRLPEVLQSAESAASLALAMKRNGDLVSARLLRAEALRRSGAADSRTVLNEALSLAQAEGMLRLLREQGARAEQTPVQPGLSGVSFGEPRTDVRSTRGPSLLTGKEHEVLQLLNRNLSNKEIALALDVGEQTIKWHVKNVFHKLNAANRKHAVARARMLGLVEG